MEIRFGDTLLILDAGTGIRALGAELTEVGDPVRATVLLTHFHWDHVQGLPFFHPMHLASSLLHIVGPADRDEYVEQRLARQMEPIFFPVPFHGVRAECRFTAWREGPLDVDGVAVRVFPVRHPSRTVGYRIETPSASICYVPDNELAGGRYEVPSDWRRRFEAFLAGADVLIHDTMYTADEYERHEGWGHSTTQQALDLAAAAGVKRLVGFHHAPERSDDDLDRLRRTLGPPTGSPDDPTPSDFSFSYAAEGDELHFG
ncbi:MAG: MBL fold metallo-hydrolase [Gemmatimonadetes bacterium]|nr:MBL fold metallo-hydrolase [Gemmatimonadota bacterium]